MSEDEVLKQPTPQERPIQEIIPDVNIDKSQIHEIIHRDRPTPLSWQPFIDQTDPTPPDGGSGVGDGRED